MHSAPTGDTALLWRPIRPPSCAKSSKAVVARQLARYRFDLGEPNDVSSAIGEAPTMPQTSKATDWGLLWLQRLSYGHIQYPEQAPRLRLHFRHAALMSTLSTVIASQ